MLEPGEIHVKCSNPYLLLPDGRRTDKIALDVLVCTGRLLFRTPVLISTSTGESQSLQTAYGHPESETRLVFCIAADTDFVTRSRPCIELNWMSIPM